MMQIWVGNGRALPRPSYICEKTGITFTMMMATTVMAMTITVMG